MRQPSDEFESPHGLDSPDDDRDARNPHLHLLPSKPETRRSALAQWLLERPWALLRRPLRRRRRHQPRSPLHRLLRHVAYLLLLILVVTPIAFPSYTRPPARYARLRARCASPSPLEGCANPLAETVFISASLYDPSGAVAGGAWGEALLRLIHLLGPGKVHLSIYENDSAPRGEAALRALEARLGCNKTVVSDTRPANYDAYPTVRMPDGTRVLKRLAYLSDVRNRALRPLDRLGKPSEGGVATTFDKVLFLNDVVFDPIDAANLLFSTGADDDTGETHYLSACALDYNQSPFLFYDLYAQRDAEGFSNGVPLFPYFSASGASGISRRAMLSQTDAVPVSSCWGGMVAARAEYLQHLDHYSSTPAPELPHPDWHRPGHHIIYPGEPRRVTAPVRFRYEPEVFFDACECCLLQADLQAVARDKGDPDTGVFVNPYVRVAYDPSTLRLVRLVQRWERLFAPVQGLITRLAGLPTHNPHRKVQQGQLFREEVYTAAADGSTEGRWEMVERTGRSGMFCGVREMQTIVRGDRAPGDRGEGLVNWKSWDVPWREQTFYFPT